MDTRTKLIQLGAETLADELIRLAENAPSAQESVERLSATPDELLKRCKSRLSGLRRARRFVSWSEAGELAAQLRSILADIDGAKCDPKTAIELLNKFFECDKKVVERSDDSTGFIGDVFRFDAQTLWVEFATLCEDKDWLADQLFTLCQGDEYSLRDGLLDVGPNYLPETQLRQLADRFWQHSEDAIQGPKKSDLAASREDRKLFRCTAAIAQSLHDPALFEKAMLAYADGKLGWFAIDIAKVYLESNAPEGALRWLDSEETAATISRRECEVDSLRLRAHEQLGNVSEQTATAKRIFESHTTSTHLESLVAIVGEKKRKSIVAAAAKRIAKGKISFTGATFLIEVEHAYDAAEHIIKHRADLDGNYYPTLLRLAKALEPSGQAVARTCIYRALLDSILARAVSTYYGHGVRYLKQLDKLGTEVRDWGDVEPHLAYRARLAESHGRKRSFWKKMEK